MRSIKIPFVLLAILMFGGIGTSIVSACNTAITFGYQFCFSEACVKFALDAFQDSLRLVKITVEACASLATVLGVFYALKTYMDSVYSRLSVERRQHYLWFSDLVKSASKKSHVAMSEQQAKGLYNFIFPHTGNRLHPSEKYLNQILSIKATIEEANRSCGGVVPFRRAAHADRIYSLFRQMFIVFEEERDAEIIVHEAIGFTFLDEINKHILETNIRLQDFQRLYKAECR
jgi:hypothetical protein